jgi:hypothetical protein
MNANKHLKFELSFLEIYNEKVTDLLATPTSSLSSNESSNPKSSNKSSTTSSFSKHARTHILNKLVPNSNSTNNSTRALEIREHPLLGPYVPDLKYIQVKTKEDFQNVLNLGNQQRSVASTNANQRSSRSHAIFTVKISRVDLPQSTTMRLSFGPNTGHSSSNIGKSTMLSNSSKKSAKQQAQDELDAQAVRLNFVDLAGSEKSQQYNGPQGKNDRFAVRSKEVLSETTATKDSSKAMTTTRINAHFGTCSIILQSSSLSVPFVVVSKFKCFFFN